MYRIDEFPTMEKNGVRYGRRHVLPYGATIVYRGAVNFSVSSKDATYAELLLSHLGEQNPYVVIPFPEEFRIGSCFSMMVFDLDIEDTEYGYRFDGPYDSVNGYRFDKDKILLDPYAKLISGRDEWGAADEVKNTIKYLHKMALRLYWVSNYHIDGFRFDLASILSINQDGAPMSSPPLLEQLTNDNILGKTKLIAEAWDADGMYQAGSFPNWGRWAEWNGRYRDCIRRFIKSEAEAGPELIWRLQGSPDMYGNRGPGASVNFVTCHDGFTLMDMCSYNEGNGEDNRDGANDNNNWNCRAEGETKDLEILTLRKRQIKNAATLLLLSRGVPMILAGDEFGNTQYGNNNTYCQDNPISWLNWEQLKQNEDILSFLFMVVSHGSWIPVIHSILLDSCMLSRKMILKPRKILLSIVQSMPIGRRDVLNF